MAEAPGNAVDWSRRYRANVARLRSGERDQIAEVIRRLSAREHDHGLSVGEQRMLRRARRFLPGPPGR